jgi:hypothetical protein
MPETCRRDRTLCGEGTPTGRGTSADRIAGARRVHARGRGRARGPQDTPHEPPRSIARTHSGKSIDWFLSAGPAGHRGRDREVPSGPRADRAARPGARELAGTQAARARRAALRPAADHLCGGLRRAHGDRRRAAAGLLRRIRARQARHRARGRAVRRPAGARRDRVAGAPARQPRVVRRRRDHGPVRRDGACRRRAGRRGGRGVRLADHPERRRPSRRGDDRDGLPRARRHPCELGSVSSAVRLHATRLALVVPRVLARA